MDLRDYSHATGQTTLTADVVIVGTGPGGAAAARVLAVEGGLKVVLVEEGPARPNFRPNLAHTNRYHMQEGGAMIARGPSMMPIAAGRGVGGGSLVNSAICWRTPEEVLQGWVPLLGGDERYASERLAPIFEEIEALWGVAETPDLIAGENNRIIVRGAQQLGLPGGLVRRNAPDCVGCGLCNFGCPVGGKASVDRNLIPMAMRGGAIVQADTRVHKILVKGDQAVGIEGVVHHPDSREPVGALTVRAERVILAAGGIGTPRLLHHSGLADRLGPAVGRGMHVHPGNAVLGRCDHPVRMWTGATQGAWFEHPELPGVLPHTLNAPPGALLLITGRVGHEAKATLAELSHLCGCVVMVSDEGEGTVGARADGRADIAYRFAPEDVARIKAGMVETAKVLLAGGASEVFAPVHRTARYTSAEALGEALAPRAIEDFALYASHPMASCRMGADPSKSVVGPTAEAHHLRGLYLADSSVFPTSLGVNPQLTTATLATAIARGLIAEG